eukprot:CAMPEP_0169154292 /NCGR_PEP_ID=MMETSP1015-20121227/52620_1 /TAXON_ID=342587 /ORGANISM="Karlodinium micrum, Strain CCMP2283" /LENGTH=723 /DNA_ID=CAMNT_0009224445 /DNA_START=225 /DNA_END=2396 /DNA_ORIENTATION=+
MAISCLSVGPGQSDGIRALGLRPSVWIRVCDIDLRMPLPPVWSENPMQDLLEALHKLLSDLDFNLPRKPPIPSGSFMRLRFLQFAGRPGQLVDCPLMPCDHLLLEWALPDEERWPMPPHALPAHNPLQECRQTDCSDNLSLFESWQKGFDAGAPSSLLPGVQPPEECHVLVRLRISHVKEVALNPGEHWLCLDLFASTLRDLFDSIALVLRSETPYSEGLGDELDFKMLDLRPQSDQVLNDDALLRALFWTQSETLTVKIEHTLGNASVVYVWREEELAQDTTGTHATLQYPSVDPPLNSSEKDSYSDANSSASEITARSRLSAHAAVLEEGIEGALARLIPHFPPQMVANTHQTRQFEFHPCLPQVVLIGDKRGGVNIVQTDDEENVRPRLVVDSCPVLAMSWMHHHPHSAVCGTADSGNIVFLRYNSEADYRDAALNEAFKADHFPMLSSLSVNCTDDFLLASGLSHDVAIYDVHTGQVLHRAHGVHNHSINVSRFANNSAHIMATASYDQTCKLWDIRQPLVTEKAVKVLNTGGPNVMCAFSPGDKFLLCSGIDTHLMQYALPSFQLAHKSLPLRPEAHQNRFRRSMYLATGRHFVTSATQESHIRFMSTSGINLGVVDFRGLLEDFRPRTDDAISIASPRTKRACKFLQRSPGHEEPFSVLWDAPSLRRGDIRLEVQDHHEYVQSIRAHPTVENCVGVLLSSSDPDPYSGLSLLHTGNL